MMLSSPDARNTSLMCTEVIDIDLLENNNCAVCGDYAKDIFTYLREAEVRVVTRHIYLPQGGRGEGCSKTSLTRQ